MVGLKFALFSFLTVSGVPSKGTQCMYGATIDNALFQARFLVFENVLMLRARLSQSALLASTLHCMGITQEKSRRGLQMFVMESNDEQCEFASLYDPLKQVFNTNDTLSGAPTGAPTGVPPSGTPTASPELSLSPPSSFPMARRSIECTPENYEKNPWVCMPGDWSGKFGELTLGLEHLLFKLTNRRTNSTKLRRFLSSNNSILKNHLNLIEEEIRVHIDQLSIPTCQLENKYLGLFCEDGHLIGCGKFNQLIPIKPTQESAMEIGTKFLIKSSMCSFNQTNIDDDDQTPKNQEPSWTDRIGKEIGSLPDYVSSWWEDVKRKGKEAWKASQRR